MSETEERASWRNAIVGSDMVDPKSVVPNELNWRVHPSTQLDALEQVLDRVGWVRSVTINQRTGNLVDGHARLLLALQREEEQIPVEYIDVSEEEERLILATLDPIGYLAGADEFKLDGLVADLDLGDLEATISRWLPKQAPDEFPNITGTSTEHECPKCGFKW